MTTEIQQTATITVELDEDTKKREKLANCLQTLEELESSGELIKGNKYIVITYCPPELLSKALGNTTFYAYAFHDQDIDEKGKPKEPHYHYVLQYAKNKDFYNLAREFHAEEYTFRIQNCMSKEGSIRYLTHADDPDKYQYPLAIVKSSSLQQVERCHRTFILKEDNDLELMHDLFRLDVFALGRKYGRDFIKNVNQYAQFVRFASATYQPLEDDGELYDYSTSFATLVMKGLYK